MIISHALNYRGYILRPNAFGRGTDIWCGPERVCTESDLGAARARIDNWVEQAR